MSFASIPFLLYFLPISVALFYLTRKINKYLSELILIVCSVVFYTYESSEYLLLIGILSILAILAGFAISKTSGAVSRITMLVSVFILVGTLVFFKYVNRLAHTNILFPLGLSFFSFRVISYIVDIYKKRISFEKNILKTLLYFTFFAQISSGPIERFEGFYKEDDTKFDSKLFLDGFWRFIFGLCKKILIADTLLHMLSTLKIVPLEASAASFLWIMSICYSLQLYYDFSGYSDMAIGITNMFGYNCRENFKHPYLSRSISEFWRRWHISLGDWFKDYIYIPMGGSRVSKARIIVNLFVVWLITGIWHGSTLNFIIWGLLYFVIIMLEKILIKPERLKSGAAVIYRLFSLFYINLLWIVFRYTDLSYLGAYLKRMFGISRIEHSDINVWHLIWDYKFALIPAILFIFPIYSKISQYMEKKDQKIKLVFEAVLSIVMTVLFILCLSFIVSGTNNPFVYANF